MKNCTNKKCEQQNPQSLSAFGKDKNKEDGLVPSCKICINRDSRIRRKTAEGKKRSKESVEKYRSTPNGRAVNLKATSCNNARIRATAEGRAKHSKSSLISAQKNPNTRKKRHNKRMKDNPLYRLTHNLSNNIRKSIKKKGYNKKSKTASLLGADYETVMNYFKELWFKRYGTELPMEYDIHHKVFNSTATTEEELIKLQYYTNLEPLTKDDHKTIHSKQGI